MPTDTCAYVNVHGHTPRGYGQWAFDVHGDMPTGRVIIRVWTTATYSHACKAARADAQQRGLTNIVVVALP